MPMYIVWSISAKREESEVPPTVIIFVDSISVVQTLVTLEPVEAIDPVSVREFVPRARFPPETLNPRVAEATVMFVVPLKETPPMVLAVSKEVAVPALPLTLPVMAFVTVISVAHSLVSLAPVAPIV